RHKSFDFRSLGSVPYRVARHHHHRRTPLAASYPKTLNCNNPPPKPRSDCVRVSQSPYLASIDQPTI
ncbi:hypothetical protein B0H67DRAFT_189369, partial [Lasiosphaeris hirsuta]